MDVVARVQAHPARSHLHDALVSSLELPAEIILHASDPPSPWDGYRACLTGIPRGVTHLLVIQDDTTVCRNFAPALRLIAQANPSTPVVLFLARLPRRLSHLATLAAKKRESYLETQLRSNDFLPVVAILWPTEKAQEFIVWAEANPHKLGHKDPRSDDAVGGRWASLTKQTIRFTVPSLVEHPDMEPSLIGRKPAWGKDSGRVAMSFAEDGLAYEW